MTLYFVYISEFLPFEYHYDHRFLNILHFFRSLQISSLTSLAIFSSEVLQLFVEIHPIHPTYHRIAEHAIFVPNRFNEFTTETGLRVNLSSLVNPVVRGVS